MKKGKEKKKETEKKEIEEKILKLLALRTTANSLGEQIDLLKKEIAIYVDKNPSGVSSKGYKYFQGEVCGVELRDNPIYQIDVDRLIKKMGLKETLKYLNANRIALINDIENRRLILTEKELKEITKISYGEKKVIPYYGRKEIF